MEEGKDKNPEDSTCYVTDGSCRTCLFPLTQSNVEAVVDADGNPSHTMTCGAASNLNPNPDPNPSPNLTLTLTLTLTPTPDPHPDPNPDPNPDY